MEFEKICSSFLEETMELNDLPGLAIGVSLDGKHWTGVAGVRDIKTMDPLKTGDIFHCASVSKLFTSSAILKLIQEGILDYDDRLMDILPDLDLEDERAKDIRLWQMLSHTSGIGDVDDYRWEEALTGEDALKDYVYSDEVRKMPMLWEPGKGGFRYSNIAYEILGHIVSKKSGEFIKAIAGPGGNPAMTNETIDYEEFVRRFLMEPAGMIDSTMKTYERIGVDQGEECPLITEIIRERNAGAAGGSAAGAAGGSAAGAAGGPGAGAAGAPAFKPMALPHEKAEDRSTVPVKYYPYTRAHGPSSTLTSDLEDLLRWADVSMIGFTQKDDQTVTKAEGHEAILSADAYQHMGYEYATVPNNGEKMGLGWFMREQCGHRLYGHEGTDDGFRASFWICPEIRLGIVVLSNISRAPVKRINKKLFELLACKGRHT